MKVRTHGTFVLTGLLALMPLASSMALAKQRPPLWEGRLVPVIPPAPVGEGTVTGAFMDIIMYFAQLSGTDASDVTEDEDVKDLIGAARRVDALVRNAKAGEVLSERAVRKALVSVTGLALETDTKAVESVVADAVNQGNIKSEDADQAKQAGKEKWGLVVAVLNEAKAVLLAAKTK